MDISQLNYFCTVADKSNITHAAQLLHITQSTLSASIQRLEQEIGVKLFDRVGRRIVLNQRGTVFYHHARAILQEYDLAIADTQHGSPGVKSVLTLACTDTNFPERLIAGFKLHHPDVSLRQILLTGDDLAADAANTDYDFVLSSMPLHTSDIRCAQVEEERMYLVTNQSHPLGSRLFVSLEDLKDESFVALPSSYYGRRFLEQLCARAGFQPQVSLECFQHHIPSMVATGMGIALFPECTVRSGSLPGTLRIIPLINEFSRRSIYLLTRQSPHADVACEYLSYLNLENI